jgi:hypothetical protein
MFSYVDEASIKPLNNFQELMNNRRSIQGVMTKLTAIVGLSFLQLAQRGLYIFHILDYVFSVVSEYDGNSSYTVHVS